MEQLATQHASIKGLSLSFKKHNTTLYSHDVSKPAAFFLRRIDSLLGTIGTFILNADCIYWFNLQVFKDILSYVYLFPWIVWCALYFHNYMWHLVCDLQCYSDELFCIYNTHMNESYKWSCDSSRINVSILFNRLSVHLMKKAVAFETSWLYSVVCFFRRWEKSFDLLAMRCDTQIWCTVQRHCVIVCAAEDMAMLRDLKSNFVYFKVQNNRRENTALCFSG